MLFQLVYFGLVFWFGLYMLNRDVGNVRLLLAGLGLIVCSAGLGAALLAPYGQGVHLHMALLKIQDISYYLPLVCWQGAVLSHTEDHDKKRNALWVLWKYGLSLLALTGSIWLAYQEDPQAYAITYQAVVCAFLLLCAALSIGGAMSDKMKRSVASRVCVYMPLIVYACITSLVLALQDGSWKQWGLIGNSVGLMLFATYTLIAEIKGQGESWLPDVLRSLDYSVFFTLLFSGQVAVVIMLGTGFNFTMLLLLMTSIAISIVFQVFVYPIRTMLDNFAFMTFPQLRHERSELRLVESVQVRIDQQAKPEEMSEEELYRHIRRALSNLGNLQRLASSPLTKLKLIDQRLRERGAADEVIERAIELRGLLVESIMQLKPRREEDFGTTDEWKHYNALYFPYVVGIKPYSVRYADEQLDAHSKLSKHQKPYVSW